MTALLAQAWQTIRMQNDVVSTSMRRKSRCIDVNRTSCAVGFDLFNNIPAGVGRLNNVVLTSMRRDDVALMSIWRNFDVMGLMG